MNTKIVTTAAPFIHAAAGRRHVARAVRWACLSAIAFLAPLSILAWSDSLLVLSTGWRWVALVLAVLALLAALISFSRACRRPSAKEAARVLDQAASLDHGYAVSTSSELLGTTPDNPVEGALLAHLHRTAASLAADAKPVHPWPGILTIFAALVAATAFLSIATKENGLAIRRALQPWTHLPYTTVELIAPADAPARREPFEITGKITGRIPRDLHLTWTGGRSATVPVRADGSFLHPLALGIQQNSTFSGQAAADGQSAPLSITLRRVPKVASYHFAINPPAYTHWPASTESRPGFVVLRGSKVDLTLQLDLPAKSVTFIPDNNQGSLTLTNPSGDGKSWLTNLGKMARTFSYRIEITDEKSTYQAEADPQMIVVGPDAPPKFESLTHNGDKLADTKPPEEFSLKFRATDDIGLDRMFITCQSLTKALVPTAPTSIPNHPLEHSGAWAISLKALRDAGVQPLDIIIVTVTAVDGNNLDGPGSISEPIFLEMPFPPADENEDDSKDGGGKGGEGEQPENVNPLALQKELHRQMVRSSLGLKAPNEKELADKQQVIAGHLEKMADSPDSAQLGEVYVEHLKQALAAARMTAQSLTVAPRDNFSHYRAQPTTRIAATHSAKTLSHLIEAAKIEAAAIKEASKNPPGEPPPPGEGKPETKYSLVKLPSKSDKKSEENEKKEEKIEKAVADIDQLQREQEQLDKEAAELAAKDGEPKDGEPKDGEPKDGEPKDGEPKDGQSKPGQNQGKSAAQLAANQDALAAKTTDIIKDIEGLEATDSQTDPKQAAEALKAAKDYQEKAAAALRASNLGKAAEMGTKTEESLDVANLLTKSLLDKQVRQSIEAQAPSPGYESLIQEYSRRISYDQ